MESSSTTIDNIPLWKPYRSVSDNLQDPDAAREGLWPHFGHIPLGQTEIL
jgi:hypothetical protein